MFEDSLLEKRFGGTYRGRAALISFALQIAFIGILVVMPLIFIEALPARELVTFLVAPPPPPPPPPPAAVDTRPIKTVKHKIVSDMLDTGQLRTPTRIPKKVAMIKESAPPLPPSSAEGVVGGVPGGIPGGVLGGVLGGIVRSTPAVHVPPPPRQPHAQRVRVSQGVTRGLLVHQVKPRYPALARQARIQGSVVLKAVIARDGSIQNLQLVSGHPLLTTAAINAVKEWRYKPYLLNGQPVEVETDITVKFTLG